MKTKDVLELFDSSVRKLKKIYGTEAMNVRTAKPVLTDAQREDFTYTLAFCKSYINLEDLQIYADLIIFPDTYLKECDRFRLSQEVIQFSIMGTACHEMAHYLHWAREMKAIRNQFVHEKAVARIAWQLFLQGVSYHGEDWKRIVGEEMGSTDTDAIWKPSREMPKIFVR